LGGFAELGWCCGAREEEYQKTPRIWVRIQKKEIIVKEFAWRKVTEIDNVVTRF
jgi:hypothetical protein